MTIAELKDAVNTDVSENFMKRLSSYTANITGTDAYWFQRRCELLAIMEQKKPATVFWTFSYADLHWFDLHRLMPGIIKLTKLFQLFFLKLFSVFRRRQR
jgi:hypothetical protein